MKAPTTPARPFTPEQEARIRKIVAGLLLQAAAATEAQVAARASAEGREAPARTRRPVRDDDYV